LRRNHAKKKKVQRKPPKANYGLIASGLGDWRNEAEAVPTTRSSWRLSEFKHGIVDAKTRSYEELLDS